MIASVTRPFCGGLHPRAALGRRPAAHVPVRGDRRRPARRRCARARPTSELRDAIAGIWRAARRPLLGAARRAAPAPRQGTGSRCIRSAAERQSDERRSTRHSQAMAAGAERALASAAATLQATSSRRTSGACWSTSRAATASRRTCPTGSRTPRGHLYGGFAPTYVDLRGASAPRRRCFDGSTRGMATVNMRVDYFEPVTAERFVVESRIVNSAAARIWSRCCSRTSPGPCSYSRSSRLRQRA